MNPLLLLLAVGALPQRLELAFTEEPGGCALDVRLPQSIARYVPRLALAKVAGEGTWRLSVVSRPGEVEILLADDLGEEQLSRVLRAEAEACAATADGIGLILERYLSDLGYETGFEPLPEIEVPTATVAPPPPVIASELAIRRFEVVPELYRGSSTVATIRWSTNGSAPTRLELDGVPDPSFPATAEGTHTATISGSMEVALIAGEERAEVRVVGVELELDGAITVEAPNEAGARVGGSVDLALELWFLRFELGMFALAPGRVAVRRGGVELGQYSVWALGGIGRAGACGEVSVFSICGLLGGGVERVQGSVVADQLFQQASRNEVGGIVSFGVRAAWEIGLFRVYFRGETVVRPDRAKFVVDGADDPYRDSRVAAFLSLGVGVQVF
jgi:hypothetical protein